MNPGTASTPTTPRKDDPGGRHHPRNRPWAWVFAEKTLVAAGQCTPIGTAPRDEQIRGRGLRLRRDRRNRRRHQHGRRPRGESVAVISGGVGAAIAGAGCAGATTIIAVDVDDDELRTAQRLGAAHTINSRTADAVEGIRELTGGFVRGLVIDAVGVADTLPCRRSRHGTSRGAWCSSASRTRAPRSICPWTRCSSHRRLVRTPRGRGHAPSRDFPMLVDHESWGAWTSTPSCRSALRSTTTSTRPSRRCPPARSCAAVVELDR
ncbi:zinc-binding dehydrogenase [Kocuria rhizophila]|nr:zinc-binding dehydrogenase [Kocuria rhizophila]